MTERLEDRLDLAFSKLGLREPFIHAVTGRLERIIVDEPHVTAATNGAYLKFGRPFCDKLDNEELLGLILHEDMHVILMHMWRREGRDPGLWNFANDAIINRMVMNKGYKLPSGGVFLDWVNESHSSEEVYNKLKQDAQKAPKKAAAGGMGGFNGEGDLEDAPSDADVADMEARIQVAAQMARECGDGSALIDMILGKRVQSTVRWQDETRAMLISSARDDYSFRRISRRYISSGIYLPSLHSDAVGGLVIGFDTSGSCAGEKECNQIAGELQAIVDDLNPEWVKVVYCDTKVTRTEHFNRGDVLELKPRGGGGTLFKPVFDWVRDEVHEQVAGLIYLTDMEGPFRDIEQPQYPVVWGNIFGREDAQAPFGRVVRITV